MTNLTTTAAIPSAAHDLPVALTLRAEALLAAALALGAYAYLGYSWWLFAALILVPDLAMVGYALGNRIGALSYNLAHTYVVPALLAAIGFVVHEPLLMALAAIWGAHIGIDRVLGYGLKLSGGFKHTHLPKLFA